MTTITFNQDNIVIEGHANFKEAGSDIVCASISTAAHFLVSLLGLTYKEDDGYWDIDTNYKVDDACYLACDVGWGENAIKVFIDICKQLQEQFPNNVKVIDKS